MKTVLITGGSSGIGQATADLFSKSGYCVYEMSRHGQDRPGITHLSGDVTIPENCQKAVDYVIKQSGALDVLICNAGMGISGAIEFTEEEEMHRQMDVNFFGAVHMVQVALPQMRYQATHSNGRHASKPTIIFVSSLAATFSIPFQAFYSASKSAINGFAFALRNELRPFGIRVACLMPGDIKTGFTNARCKSLKGQEVYRQMEQSVKVMEHDEQNGQSPECIARTLLKIARSRYVQATYYTGFSYHLLAVLNKVIPASVVYRLVAWLYHT